MAADVACPGCGARLKVPESMLGKKAKCKKCGRSFLTPGQTANGDSVGESQFLSTIDTPLEALPADAEFIPSAEAIEEDSPAPAAKVQPPPSANLYNPTSPAAKSSSKPSAKQPPPAPLTPKPAFGSAKAPAVPVQPAMPPAPAKSKPAAAAGPLSKAPARPTPPQKELEALPLDEVLPLDEALPLDDQPARATAPPGDSALPEDSFSFTTVPPPDKEGRKKARVREENQDEEPRPRKKKTAREEEEADPLATPFEGSSPTVATASPFSFDAGPGTTAKGISGKRDRDEEDELQPSRTKKGAKLRDDGADLPKPTAAPAAAPTSDDPFAFSAGPDPDEEESRGKRNRRAPDDDDEDDRREDRRYHREGEKKSNAPLLIAGAVGLLAVLVCMGGGIVYLLKKTPETAKKPDEKAGPPVDQAVQPEPAKENAPKKDAPKKDLGKKDGAVKDAADPTPKRSPKAGVDPGTPAVAMLALPAALTKYDFRPVGTQLERVHEAEKTKPLVDAQYEKVKRFFPPFKAGDNDTLVVWESNPGFNGSGVKYTVEVHSGSTGSKVGRFEFDGDGQGLKCDVSRDGKAFAAAADGKVTVWNLADRTKTLDAFEPYADKPDHRTGRPWSWRWEGRSTRSRRRTSPGPSRRSTLEASRGGRSGSPLREPRAASLTRSRPTPTRRRTGPFCSSCPGVTSPPRCSAGKTRRASRRT
jgi:hypothetical protein